MRNSKIGLLRDDLKGNNVTNDGISRIYDYLDGLSLVKIVETQILYQYFLVLEIFSPFEI